MNERQKLYDQGYMFLRTRKRYQRNSYGEFNNVYSIYISREFGSWRLAGKFDYKEDMDIEIESFKGVYDNVIVE
jgi:hypothetical protein